MITTTATSVLPDNRHPTNSNLVKGICYNITYSSQICIKIKKGKKYYNSVKLTWQENLKSALCTTSKFWIWVTYSIEFSIC